LPGNLARSIKPTAADAAASTTKGITNMTKTEIGNDILTDAELDGVVGGLNPQPLPPGPPPESFLRSFTHFAFNRFELARFSNF
jgi:hypothetical protein